MWVFLFLPFLIPVAVLLYWQLRDNKLLKTVTQKDRGTWSERDLVLKLLKKGIPSDNIFHDLYVRKQDGSFSQIDLVITTEVGIIVVEVKRYSGWIFGTGLDSQWLQVLAYGKDKYFFYNPILQNSSHIRHLKNQTRQFDDIPFYSLIVFYGDCVLKKLSFIPTSISIVKSYQVLDAINNILQNNKPANYTNTAEVSQLLDEAVKNGADKENRIQHIRNIENLLR